jgi:signal transduction histidine kinase
MATAEIGVHQQTRHDSGGRALQYAWVVGISGLVFGVFLLRDAGDPGLGVLIPWVIAALVGDALAVRLTRSVALSASLPVTLAAAFVMEPAYVGLVGFLGVWQLPGRSSANVGFALFNRTEVGLAAAAGAAAIHAVGVAAGQWPAIILATGIGLAVDGLVNVGLMLPIIVLKGSRLQTALRDFVGSKPLTIAAAYLSALLAAPVLVLAWSGAGSWGLLAAMICVTLAGLASRTAQKQGEVETQLESARLMLRDGVRQVEEERRDERRNLAGELHDEVLPAMFKVHLMGEVIRRDLETGRLLDLDDDVRSLLTSTEYAQLSIRDVVGGLRQSAVGPRGLSAALRSYCDGLHLEATKVDLDVDEVQVDSLAQTVAYQVIREAVANAAKYAKAGTINVRVCGEDGGLRVTVRDDGVGFDVRDRFDRDGHFGLALMQERTAALGGRLEVESVLGSGTHVWAHIPSKSRSGPEGPL